MQEQYKSIITADGWILCAKCGHKLARVIGDKSSITPNSTLGSRAIIELKCQSCKALNKYGGEDNAKN